jgi:hypothetical protein
MPRRLAANSFPSHSMHGIDALLDQHFQVATLEPGMSTILEYVFIDGGGKTGTTGVVPRSCIVGIVGIHLQLASAA